MDLNESPGLPGAEGAEMCPECHGDSVTNELGAHFVSETGGVLGLKGNRDVSPDAGAMGVPRGNCG